MRCVRMTIRPFTMRCRTLVIDVLAVQAEIAVYSEYSQACSV